MSACQHSPPLDSLAAECPTGQVQAPRPLSSLAQLQHEASERLSRLGLVPRWRLDGPALAHASAQAFVDTVDDRERLARLLAAVLPALEQYSADWLQAQRLRDIVLLKDLKVAGQARVAMPAPEQDALVYADNGALLCAAGMQLRVHHEFYHFIEYRRFGDFYYRDPAWLALNPPALRYGAGGASAYRRDFQNLGHPQPGAVSAYALYGPEEDKAEVFAWLQTPGYAERLDGFAAQDLSLAAKRDWMRALLGRP